jgi:soluble lytic murein transglycosylase-like protein
LLTIVLWPGAVRSDADVLPLTAEPRPNPIAHVVRSLSYCSARLSGDDRWRLAGIIHDESQRRGYDPLFVVAMIQIESGCLRTARGPGDGDGVGLIQITPTTARAVARDADLPWHGVHTLTRPAVNVRLSLEYLSQLEERFRDPLVAMAAYNMGPNRVAQMSRQRARGAGYVRKILARYEQLLAGAHGRLT